MSSKARVFHSVILILVIISFIFYSTYNSSESVQISSSAYHIKAHDDLANITYTQSKSVSMPVALPIATEKLNNVTTNSTGSNEKVITESLQPAQVIQVIPPRKTNSAVDGKNQSKGLLTNQFYEAGHDIPNLELCPDLGAPLRFLILIMSAPNHANARMAIRQTWGHFAQRRDISMSFMLGRAATEELNKSIQSESVMYGDIIGGRFIDSYDNLTLKTTSMMEWIDNYCSQVRFILKTDDDMFINVPKLISFVEKRNKSKRTIYGRLAKKWRPIRGASSKYYVSSQQYAAPVFPDFTTGPAYLLTGDIVHELYVTALNMTYLKLEDVFTTGVVAEAIKAKRVHANEFSNKRLAFSVCNIKNHISIHMIKYHEQFDLWKKLLDGKGKCA